jgi:hypothetical protein
VKTLPNRTFTAQFCFHNLDPHDRIL